MASQVLRNPQAPAQPKLGGGERAVLRDAGTGDYKDRTGRGSGALNGTLAKGVAGGKVTAVSGSTLGKAGK